MVYTLNVVGVIDGRECTFRVFSDTEFFSPQTFKEANNHFVDTLTFTRICSGVLKTSIHSNVGDNNNGLLRLTVSTTPYVIGSATTSIAPINPGQNPIITANTTTVLKLQKNRKKRPSAPNFNKQIKHQ